MEMLNEWLQEIQASGMGKTLYNSTGAVCTVLMYLSIVLYTWRTRINPVKAIIISYLARMFLGYAQHLVTWYRRGFELDRYMGTGNIGYAFILLPIFCVLCDWTFNVNRGTSGELVAITTMGWHFVGRSGCTFVGCCYGIDCNWGVYSQYAEGNTFPVCWLESLLSLGILIFLVVRMLRRDLMPEDDKVRPKWMQWYYRKRRVPDDGKALPYLLLFYGTGRFFTEFLRHHDEEYVLFGFLPEFSVCALLMALIGGGLLYANIKKSKAKAESDEQSQLSELKALRR